MKKIAYISLLVILNLQSCIVIGGNWGGKARFSILILPLMLLLLFFLFRSLRRP